MINTSTSILQLMQILQNSTAGEPEIGRRIRELPITPDKLVTA
jgi:hypothetical protein